MALPDQVKFPVKIRITAHQVFPAHPHCAVRTRAQAAVKARQAPASNMAASATALIQLRCITGHSAGREKRRSPSLGEVMRITDKYLS
jgi:hypothetical protein